MKTTASFRLSKYAKRMIAQLPFRNEDERGLFKRMMIDGQIAASIKPKAQKTRDVNNMPINDAT